MNDAADQPPSGAPTGDSAERDAVHIVGRIGTDPEELKRWADAVVDRGEDIKDMEIADLRALIEAVQSHPRAKLAPAWKRGEPVSGDEQWANVTRLTIEGGCVLSANCGADPQQGKEVLDIRVTLTARCRFAGPAQFGGASFAGWASFNGARFAGLAWFVEASFAGGASFEGASFAGAAWFDQASFPGVAWFHEASFANEASFGRASFAGRPSFDDASFARTAHFDGASFAGGASFDEASFESHVVGDLRTCTVRTAGATTGSTMKSYRLTLRPLWALPIRLFVCAGMWMGNTWLGWHRVRSLGRLAILNRISIIALFAVPIIASAFVALRAVIAKHTDSGLPPPFWVEWLIRIVGNDPHLSVTLALTFFAAVAVTLGLLIYQSIAPDTIKKHDEEEHLREVDARYPEKSEQRDDGLRRAIEQLEQQAANRRNHHANFVKHYGDLIWIPPRDKIEWFRDDTLPTVKWLQTIIDKSLPTEKRVEKEVKTAQGSPIGIGDFPEAVAPSDREGFVPGAERARICIEEGARAEYWLLAHKSMGWAWLSFLCYGAGIACLLVIVYIQCGQVARAAGMLPQTAKSAATSPAP